MFQLIFIVGVLIPFCFILLYLISVKYHPLLGIFSPSWYFCFLIGILFSIGVLSIICCVDLIPFDITLHVLMCFGINHLLILFFLNHVLIWILIYFGQPFCVTLWCALFLVYLVFSSKLYLVWFLKDFACTFSNIYIYIWDALFDTQGVE